MFIYAQLDNEGYCIAISTISEEVKLDSMISLETQDNSYFNRKYDVVNGIWTDEYREVEPIPQSLSLVDVHEDIKQVKQVATNTDGTVSLSSDDVLTLLEIQLGNQDMLFKIMTHLGI